MTKSKIYTVIMIIACVLIVGLVAGLIATAVKKNNDSGAVDIPVWRCVRKNA